MQDGELKFSRCCRRLNWANESVQQRVSGERRRAIMQRRRGPFKFNTVGSGASDTLAI